MKELMVADISVDVFYATPLWPHLTDEGNYKSIGFTAFRATGIKIASNQAKSR